MDAPAEQRMGGRTVVREEYTVREGILFFRRQRGVYMITLVIAALLWAYFSFLTPTIYRAGTVLAIEGRPTALAQPSMDPLNAVTLDDAFEDVASAIEILRSSSVLNDAGRIADINLPPPGSDIPGPDIDVAQVGTTRAVQITVDWTNREEAQRLAQAITQSYNETIRRQRNAEIASAIDHLNEREQEELAAVRVANQTLADADRERGAVSTQDEGQVLANRASNTKLSLESAENQLASSRERYESLRQQINQVRTTRAVPTSQTNIERRQREEARLDDLRVRKQALLADFFPDSPEVRALDAEIRAQDQVLRNLPKDITTNVDTRNPLLDQLEPRLAEARADYVAAQGAAARARTNYTEAQAAVDRFMAALPARSQLLVTVERHQRAIGEIQRTRDSLNSRRRSLRESASVLTAAFVNQTPLRPQPIVYAGIAVLVWLLVASGVAFLREQVDDRISSFGEAYEVVNAVPILGAVSGRLPVPRQAIGAKGNVNLEPFRLLRINLESLLHEGRPISIVVSGITRREQHTNVAINLATVLSQDRRVLLVDSDIERQAAAKALALSGPKGLIQVIDGTASLPDSVLSVPGTTLKFLPAGTAIGKVKAATSDDIERMLSSAKELFDVIVVDAGPVLDSADASLFAMNSDGVLLVVRLEATRREGLAEVVERLTLVGAKVLGLIMSK